MIIKHGLTVADIGKGELSASLEGLQLVTGIVLPPLAGALYNVSAANRLPTALPSLTCLAARLAAQFFLHPPRSTPAYLRWGPGGSYMVGAGLYMLSTLGKVCCDAPACWPRADYDHIPVLMSHGLNVNLLNINLRLKN